MSKKKQRQAPSPAELEAMVQQLVRDALVIGVSYKILHKRAYDSTGSAPTDRISGGSLSNPVLDALSGSRDLLQEHAESIGRRVREAGRELDNARTDVNRSVGRQFRQPMKPSAKATVDGAGLQAAIDRRRARFARGEE